MSSLMHYYQFNIGDYASHTQHLDELEDLAYRRMIDYCYLNECGLPETVERVARVIRMQMHQSCIANVLQEYFYQKDDGTWHNKRIEKEISDYHEKSSKRSVAAHKRWEKEHANALQNECKSNANHKPLTINQEPILNTTDQQADQQLIVADEPKQKKYSYSTKDLVSVGVNEAVARDFMLLRKKHKADLTETALKGIVREADKAGYTLEQALTVCAERGWRSFNADWVRNKQSGQYITFYELATGHKPDF